jgi:hypothetical protein
MRDPRQLEFNFDQSTPELTTAELDAIVKEKLIRQSVLCWCWGVENGHRKFYDTCPPSTEAFQSTLTWLLANPEQYGNQAISTIEAELKRRSH